MAALSVAVPGTGAASVGAMAQCPSIPLTAGPLAGDSTRSSTKNPQEQQTSMDPKCYTWGNPSQEQQQRLFQQFMQIAMFQQAALQHQRGMPGQPPVAPFPFFPGFCSMPAPPGFGGMLPFFPGTYHVLAWMGASVTATDRPCRMQFFFMLPCCLDCTRLSPVS
jgi:hypothetical protein